VPPRPRTLSKSDRTAPYSVVIVTPRSANCSFTPDGFCARTDTGLPASTQMAHAPRCDAIQHPLAPPDRSALHSTGWQSSAGETCQPVRCAPHVDFFCTWICTGTPGRRPYRARLRDSGATPGSSPAAWRSPHHPRRLRPVSRRSTGLSMRDPLWPRVSCSTLQHHARLA